MTAITAAVVRLLLVALILTTSGGIAACGSGQSDSTATTPVATTTAPTTGSKPPQMTKAALILDFLPNAVHAGIYRAVAAGYYKDNNIDLKIIPPTSTSDTLKLIDAGKADFGVADGIDLANQIDAGRGAKAIAALVQRPLGGIITTKNTGITNPKQFEGQTVGITGVPSDTAILNTIVEHAGGTPAKVKKVTIGFNGVQNLENGKVKGFIGFYPADGVQVQLDGQPITSFPFDANGGPRYPGLVFFSTEQKIASSSPLMKAFVDATAKGYEDTVKDPAQSLDDLLSEVKSLKRPLTEAQLKAYGPLFVAGASRWGELNTSQIQALSDFLVKAKLVKKPFTPERYGTNEFLPAQQ